jgi:NAD(P)-dependent dehydrogenase (short-subunit alcohol dehydrogenase family)
MKIVVITGANSGIGLVTALELARNGYRVVAGMRSVERGAELMKIASAERLPIEAVALDLTQEASCEQAVRTVLERHGRIDVLVNNAGIGVIAPIEEADLNEVRMAFETNVFGPMRLVQLVLPGMRERQAGCIVNLSSIAGRFVNGGQGFYAASKFALEAASEALAQELRRFGIRVCIIEPGVTRTPALERIPGLKPDTAYVPLMMRAGKTLGARIARAADASTIAIGIRHAIESSEYRLRHPLGEDTHRWLAGRARLTDEQWVDYGRDQSDDELSKFWQQHFDMAI